MGRNVPKSTLSLEHAKLVQREKYLMAPSIAFLYRYQTANVYGHHALIRDDWKQGEESMSVIPSYDPDEGKYRASFEWTDSLPPSIGVVETVAAIEGRDPTELPSLSERCNADSLDVLVGYSRNRPGMGDVTVELTYCDYDVAVSGDGTVVVFET